MFQSLITFFYVVVCILLILSVLMQHYKSDSQKGSSSYFGGSGSKDFLYRSTKYLIVCFFALAFLHTSLRYRSSQKEMRLTRDFSAPIPTQSSSAPTKTLPLPQK